MRIVFVAQSYPPMVSGAAQVVQRLARGMAARGHTTLVLTASDQGAAYTRHDAGCTVLRLPALPNPLRVRQRFVLWAGGRIRRALLDFRPDVCHLHDPTNLGLLGLRSARALGVPVILTFHALPVFVSAYLPPRPLLRRPVEALLWRYYDWWMSQCQAVITPSRIAAGIVEQHAGRRPLALSNGVDLARFSPEPAEPGEAARLRACYGLDPERPIILYAGRLDADKLVRVVVRAAAEAMRASDAQLVVVGDGTERQGLEALAAELGIGARARFTGYVSAEGDLPGLYRLARVFCSASEVETQSCVMLEASASGVPVVVARATSMPEMVLHGVSGFLAPPGDASAMAGYMLELLRDPERARAMGRAGCEHAHQHTLPAALAAHEALYRSVVGGA